MLIFITALFLSFAISLTIVIISPRLIWGKDEILGVQKFHRFPVPRLGGIGIFVGTACAGLLLTYGFPEYLKLEKSITPLNHELLTTFPIPRWAEGTAKIIILLLAVIPLFLAGLVEDITRKVTPRIRLIAAFASVFLAIWWTGRGISSFDITGLEGFDIWLSTTPVAILILTGLVISGITNAINIIDGYNGLATVVAIAIAFTIAYVGYMVGDPLVYWQALILIAGLGGFFILNFPAGLIFLGDAGAYFVGFWLAETGLLLVERNSEVSPWFCILIFSYPITELLFSIYRRRFVNKTKASIPDGAHLHHIIFKRIVLLVGHRNDPRYLAIRNSMTAPYLWIMSCLTMIPALLWWRYTEVMILFFLLFTVLYIWLYRRIIKFKTPKKIVFRWHGNFIGFWIDKIQRKKS